jgi:hypothetical protein
MSDFYAIYPPNPSGTVSSVGLSLPAQFNVAGSPVIGVGTITVTWASESQNLVFASPNGSSGVPTFRALVNADLPAGIGTVTSVSVVTANGVSGSVATATTTPAITLTLGAITPSSVNASGTVLGSNLSGTNTGNVTLGTANGLGLAGQVLSLGLSSTSTTGALSSTDWNTFNNKQGALTLGNLTDAGTDGIVVTGGTGAVVGSGTSIAQHVADSTHNGYLSSADWSTFNSKGTGTVTSVSVVTANGVSGSVATATTTPAITLTLGAITPSSVNASGTVAGSNLSGTNTGDITLAAVGASPSANGASLSGQALTLQPFDSTHPGVVTSSGGGTSNFLRADGTWATPTGSSVIQTAYVKELQTSGTDAGTFTSGAWQTRILNTLENPGSFAWISLASNQITLSAGTYLIEAQAPCTMVNRNQAKLENISDSTDTVLGTSNVASAADGSNTIFSYIRGQFTIASTKTFEIQHKCQTTAATNGFGNNAGMGVSEVYTVVKLQKIA